MKRQDKRRHVPSFFVLPSGDTPGLLAHRLSVAGAATRERVCAMDGSKRIAFLVREGLDGLADASMESLEGLYDLRKIRVTEPQHIDAGLEWADICWFEICDDIVAYASRQPRAADKRLVCRLHGFEAFTDQPAKVNWETVDLVLFTAGHVQALCVEKFGLDAARTAVLPLGIDVEKYTYKERAHGRDVACAGTLGYGREAMLLIHAFKAMHDRAPELRLHLAGLFQDERDILYFKQMTKEWGLSEAVFFDGWQEDLDVWLNDKDYYLCTSLFEAQCTAVMEAMAKGIKPLIHNFVGARTLFPSELVFNTMEEAADMLAGPYESKAYRAFIQARYGREETVRRTRELVRRLAEAGPKAPLVSIVMAVHNGGRYVGEAVGSILAQTYANLEVIVVNDGSTDNTADAVRAFGDPRVRLIRREKRGLQDALRFAIGLAGGKYIARVDSDAALVPEYIASCVEAMAIDSALDFVYTDFATINAEGEVIGEIRFKDYETPKNLVTDVFTSFSSVIPEACFWKREYIRRARPGLPFYIENVLECRMGHIKAPLYRFRQHEQGGAADAGCLKDVLGERVRAIDLLIKKYFIQMDINGEFRKDRRGQIALYAKYFTLLAKPYKNAGKAVVDLFLSEAAFWQALAGDADPSAGATLNRSVLLLSADDPARQNAERVQTHMRLLQKGLEESGAFCQTAAFGYAPELLVDMQTLMREWGAAAEALAGRDNAFLFMVYAMQKQLEKKLEVRLRASYVGVIACQDVIAVHAADSVLLRLEMDVPVTLTLHGRFADESVHQGLVNAESAAYAFFVEYERSAYARADSMVAANRRIARHVAETAGERSGEKTVLVYDAVDDVRFSPEENPEPPEGNVILVPLRMAVKSGVPEAVQAAAVMRGMGFEDFLMVVAGDGPDRKAVESLIEQEGLRGYVRLPGKGGQERTPELYRSARAVAVPAPEGGPAAAAGYLPALEAMACGRVVVATDAGELSEIIDDGRTGLLVPPGDADALAAALIRVLRMERGQYRELAANARARVHNRHGCLGHTQRLIGVFDACWRKRALGDGSG